MRLKFSHLFFLVFLSLFFISCSHKKQTSNTNYQNQTTKTSYTYKNINVSSALLQYYNEYKGVRYKYGGINKNGLDCSAYVQNSFKQTLNVNLPRTTLYQSKVGRRINKSQLRAGDLVFFRTSLKYRHVGVYISSGSFMHVSTSKGVMISKLSNIYWKKHYWKSMRVLEN